MYGYTTDRPKKSAEGTKNLPDCYAWGRERTTDEHSLQNKNKNVKNPVLYL
jgi:hypothetical protein